MKPAGRINEQPMRKFASSPTPPVLVPLIRNLTRIFTNSITAPAIGVVLNTFVLVPLYSSFMPLTEIIKMGQAIFPAIDGTFTFCLYCVGPFNIIKGLIISVVVFIIYKPLSRLINSLDALLTKKKKATVQ